MKKIFLSVFFLVATGFSFYPNNSGEIYTMNNSKFYAYYLDGEIVPAFETLKPGNQEQITTSDLLFQTEFENCIIYNDDNRQSPENLKSSFLCYLVKFTWSKRVYIYGFGKTGKPYPLRVGKTQQIATCCFSAVKQQAGTGMLIMDKFITPCWQE